MCKLCGAGRSEEGEFARWEHQRAEARRVCCFTKTDSGHRPEEYGYPYRAGECDGRCENVPVCRNHEGRRRFCMGDDHQPHPARWGYPYRAVECVGCPRATGCALIVRVRAELANEPAATAAE